MEENENTQPAQPQVVQQEVDNSKIVLAEVPTQFGLVYRTPEGDMSQEQYLVWLGNLMLETKVALKG